MERFIESGESIHRVIHTSSLEMNPSCGKVTLTFTAPKIASGLKLTPKIFSVGDFIMKQESCEDEDLNELLVYYPEDTGCDSNITSDTQVCSVTYKIEEADDE
jgi:hypothetical protein